MAYPFARSATLVADALLLLALLADLYELTMAYGYWKTGLAERESGRTAVGHCHEGHAAPAQLLEQRGVESLERQRDRLLDGAGKRRCGQVTRFQRTAHFGASGLHRPGALSFTRHGCGGSRPCARRAMIGA